MITIISPTTTMNFNKDINIGDPTNPFFIDEVNNLINILKSFSIEEVASLMNLSSDLAKLNYERYHNFNNKDNPKCQSILAFDGEVFSSMDVSTFSAEDITFANNHIRILSGLYGILRPSDLIAPYRLEMKSKFYTKDFKNLYAFWKSKINSYLMKELEIQDEKILVNLASGEYLKAVDLKLIKSKFRFIDIVFKEYNPNDNTYKVKGLYAKKARGYMVSYLVKNSIDNVEDLKKFNIEGYSFNNSLSTEEVFIFTR